ncbi:MAG: putative Peptidase and chymotrypsin/Hap, partial [Ilumatobacteraceae bacterium]|nr:putative Peptidase and chymotrypsin/Hap [Ilumatobacteraceae bacterium]
TAPVLTVASAASGGDVQTSIDTLSRYFAALNAHDFPTAHGLLSAAKQAKLPLEKMASGADTSHDTDIVVESIGPEAGGVVAIVTFTSTQSAEDSRTGDECTRWRVRYELVPYGLTWLIDDSTGVAGARPDSSC